MVDVVLDDDLEPADAEQRPAGSNLAGLARGARRRARGVVALITGLALLLGSASTAGVARRLAQERADTASMSGLDGGLLPLTARPAALWSIATAGLRTVVATRGSFVRALPDLTAVSAVDAETGEERWLHRLPANVLVAGCAQPPADGAALTCLVGPGGAGQSLLTLALADGAEVARVTIDRPVGTTVHGTDDGDVLVVSLDGDVDGAGAATVTRLSPVDGHVRWSTTVPGLATRPYGSGIFARARAGILELGGVRTAAIDTTTGAPVPGWPDGTFVPWAPLFEAALPDGGYVLRAHVGGEGDLGTVRDRSGDLRFALTAPLLRSVPDDGSDPGVLLLSGDLGVVGADARTGRTLWTADLPGQPVAPSVRYDRAVVVATADEDGVTVQRLDLRTGAPRWSARWAGMANPQLFLDGSTILVAASSAAASVGPFHGAADALRRLDLADGRLRAVPWPDGLSAPAWFAQLDHRLYAVSDGGATLTRVG